MSSHSELKYLHREKSVGTYTNEERKIVELDWRSISHEEVSDEFIEKYQDSLDWELITPRNCYKNYTRDST